MSGFVGVLCRTGRGSRRPVVRVLGAVALLTVGLESGGWGEQGRVLAQAPEAAPIHMPLLQRGFAGRFPAPWTPRPTETASPTSTATPSPTLEPTATATDEPTPEPTTGPTPTEAGPAPEWLARVNAHRALARLAPVTANEDWGRGGELHARYMVKNDVFGHSEQRGNAWFTEAGHAAAQNGNVHISSEIDRPSARAIDTWMVGPFHQVAIIDPRLRVSGFGEWREAIGRFHYGATLDVLRGREALRPGQRFPARYPEEGQVMPLLAYDGGESPDPLTGCSGYAAPTGPPLVMMIGGGERTPDVGRSELKDAEGRTLEHCVYDETSYRNPNGSQQALGRGVLDLRDAIVLIPRRPFEPASEYTVSLVESGRLYSWTFQTIERQDPGFEPMPPQDAAVEEAFVREVNLRRREAGLPPFEVDARLTHAARKQAQDMAAGDFGSHVGSDGSTPESRMDAVGYRYTVFSVDFITGGDGNAASLVEHWMNGPATRAHILSDKAEMGIGYGLNPDTALKHYWYVYYATEE